MERRLTTIVAADIAGFSRLIGVDEEGTLTAQGGHRAELIDPLIEQHGGRIANTAGDSLLIEFPSAVQAVRCCVAVQDGMAERNAGVPEDRRILYRIGINVGDVMDQDGDLLGDGVNIAARLEALAPPGGIVISRTARDQIRDRDDIALSDLGEVEVKNIARPVRAFQVVRDGEVAAHTATTKRRRPTLLGALVAVLIVAVLTGYWIWQRPDFEPANAANFDYPLPEKPSIAVLAFDNLSGDPSQEYIADGLSEDITAVLAGIPQLFVIARNSAFAYKGKQLRVSQIAEELGVRFLLEGSVQRSGERLRVTASLVDAIKGNPIWSERYDREMSELFAVKDDITTRIAASLNVELVRGDTFWARAADVKNLEAWLLHMQAWEAHDQWSAEGNAKAIRLSTRAVGIEPTSAQLHAGLGWRYFMQARFRWTSAPEQSIANAKEAAKKSLGQNRNSPSAYALLTAIYLYEGEFGQAIEAGQTANRLAPNDADMLAMLGMAYQKSILPDQAIEKFTASIRHNPHAPVWILENLGESYVIAGRYEDAIEVYKRALKKVKIGSAVEGEVRLGLAISHFHLGREDEARASIKLAVEAFPQFSVEYLRAWSMYKESAYTDQWLATLQRLGLPEK